MSKRSDAIAAYDAGLEPNWYALFGAGWRGPIPTTKEDRDAVVNQARTLENTKRMAKGTMPRHYHNAGCDFGAWCDKVEYPTQEGP